jgi:hypothetical protein
MKARTNPILAVIGAAFALVAAMMIASPAAAGCPCNPPPPCCQPPQPPTPPSYPCCQPPNINVNIPGVNVNVGASIIVNANVQAQASVLAGGGGVVYFSGGGGGGYIGQSTPGLIQGLNVDGGLRRASYEATRTKMTRVVIQAVCIDDRSIPHPASQVSPDRNIDDAFEGEMYRCIAGASLQATIADYHERVDFSGGRTLTCQKNDALWHGRGGKVECRRQTPARDCNERSLLRRFGAGIKILTMVVTERYTAYREEEEKSEAFVATSMSLDGGVGGIVY